MDLKQKRVRVWTKDVNLQTLTNTHFRFNARTSFISWPTVGFLTYAPVPWRRSKSAQEMNAGLRQPVGIYDAGACVFTDSDISA